MDQYPQNQSQYAQDDDPQYERGRFEYTPQRRVRKKQKPWWYPLLVTAPILICILGFGLVYLVTGGFGMNKANAPAASAPSNTQSLPISADVPPVTPAAVQPTPLNTEGTSAEPQPSGSNDASGETGETDETEPVTTEPEPSAPAEKTFTTVEKDYFDDALFIGDSRTDGLRLYDPPSSKADFYCGTSMTIFGVLDSDVTVNGVTGLYNVLAAKQYGKVYIMFGINECGYDTDYFLKQYANVIDTIRQYQPNALIYIQSILYVSQNKEWSEPVFSSDTIKEKNAGLKELANGEDIFYLEVNDVLNDGTDHLPSDYTGDGAHLKANKYYLWRDYLYEHAIVDETHPYPL